MESGRSAFTMSPKKWLESTGAIGIQSKSGRYDGAFAHFDIAMEFAPWISPEFKLYIIKDYQRLKTDEGHRSALEWNAKRELMKSLVESAAAQRLNAAISAGNLLPQSTNEDGKSEDS